MPRDWLLEDRCLLSGGPPYTFPTPYANSISDVLSNEVQVLSHQTGTNYQKTITITNNSPTQTLYAFLEGEATSQAIAPYQGTSEYDPFDASNQEYRGYVGYNDGTNDDAGLPPLSAITITVPLAFWDSGRIIFSTDGADQFSTYGGSNGGSVPGAPFNYQPVNTSATFFCNLDGTKSGQLDFTPIYNSFDRNGMPTTASWKSPVTSGLFTNGETFTVTGGDLPNSGVQVTIDSSHPNDVTLPQGITTSKTPAAYTFQLSSGQSISPTVRYVQPGLTLTTQGSPSTTNGLVMWYHALQSQAPSNEAPFQLTELTFRGTLYTAVPGFQALMDANDFNGARTDSLDYDLSFVDSINLPVAMEATNVSIPNTTSSAPFGWVGSGQSVEAFQAAITAFASTNSAGGGNANDLGTYFSGGQGYPSYINVEPGNLKLPSGQNLFLGSPAVAAPADIKFSMQFPDGSSINEPLYLLTSGGAGPTQLAIGGDSMSLSQGDDLGLHVDQANTYALEHIINVYNSPSHPYQVTYGNNVFAGNVVGLYDSTSGQVIGVQLDRPVPADPSQYVYTFTQSIQDYAASRVAGLWYSWAKYYADNVTSTPQDGLAGTISAGNILTLANPAPGLVPGMTVTGAGIPAGCIILSIAPDQKTIELSAVASGNPTSFRFASPSFSSIVGFENGANSNTPLVDLSFTSTQQAYALAFAETVFVVMSAWSQTVPAGTNAWDPLLVNIIGGNLGPNYFQNTNTDITNALTVLSKSALRGVPDYTNPLYANPAQWYPDPALPAGGQTDNVFNLDPFVWFIHEKLGITAYAFSLDDDIGNVNAGGATDLAISIGGLNGLPNRDPYTNESNWGVLPTDASINVVNSSELGGLTNPQVVQQIIPFNYNQDRPGTLVNGPGVPMGTTVQFVQIPPDITQSTMTLSNPLTSSSPGDSYSFFGPMTFTGTVLGSGQGDDTIILNNPDAYTTLMKLGPLQSIQVTGEGIDPTKTVTIQQLTKDLQTGVITLQLTGSLDPSLVTQPGGSYAYTFGSPVVGLVRDGGFEWADVQGLGGQFNHGAQLSQNTVDWTFTDGSKSWFAGIAYGNTSNYTNGNSLPLQGLQVGFVQGDSRISQTVTLGSGPYLLSLDAAQWAQDPSPQSLNVLVDGVQVGTIAATSPEYKRSAISFTVQAAGKHTITFVGTQMSTSTELIDALTLVPAPAVSSPGPPQPPVFSTIPDQRVNERSTISFTAIATGSTPPLTYSLDPGAPPGATIDPKTGVFTWTPTTPGRYTVTVHVTDGSSPPLSAGQAVSITVKDIAPSVALNPGVAATQTADFRDTGSFASMTPGSFTATVNYGDGTGRQPLALSPSGTFVLAHTYTRPGTFTVTVGVRDAFGGLGTARLTVTATAAPLVSGFGRGHDAFVTTLFRKDLGRLPSPKGLKFWSRLLAERVPPKIVARGIWRDPEHRRLVHQGLVARIPFQRSYADALRAGRRAARLHLPPPAGPLSLTVRSS